MNSIFKENYNSHLKELGRQKSHCEQLLNTDLKEPNRQEISQLKAINDIRFECAIKAFKA